MKENKKLSVLQLGKFYPMSGGVEKVMYELTTGFSELCGNKIHCDMMCATVKGGNRIIFISGGAKLICCRTLRKVAATMIAPSMITELKRTCNNYDIIHIHHPDPMACLALFMSGYKGKVILHWHSDIKKQKYLLELYRPLQEWLLRRADLILGTTDLYLTESPCLSNVQYKTACLPIGIDPIYPNIVGVETIRSKYKYKKIIFSLGRLVAYKGYKYLIGAARYLSDDYVILIGGSGPLADELNAEIHKYGLEKKVELLGRISEEELPDYYGACKVFCLSSVQKTEAFGIVQIEAMSCGKPVVATNIPQSGVSWVNKNGFSGLNVEPGNSKELAEAIISITSDEKVYSTYSKNAKQRYKEMFTKSSMINKCSDFYFRLWREQN